MSAFYLQVKLWAQIFFASFNHSRKRKRHVFILQVTYIQERPPLLQVNKEITTVFFSLFFSDDSIVLPTIIVGTLVIVFGLPFFSVANISLYSKITDEKTQGK